MPWFKGLFTECAARICARLLQPDWTTASAVGVIPVLGPEDFIWKEETMRDNTCIDLLAEPLAEDTFQYWPLRPTTIAVIRLQPLDSCGVCGRSRDITRKQWDERVVLLRPGKKPEVTRRYQREGDPYSLGLGLRDEVERLDDYNARIEKEKNAADTVIDLLAMKGQEKWFVVCMDGNGVTVNAKFPCQRGEVNMKFLRSDDWNERLTLLVKGDRVTARRWQRACDPYFGLSDFYILCNTHCVPANKCCTCTLGRICDHCACRNDRLVRAKLDGLKGIKWAAGGPCGSDSFTIIQETPLSSIRRNLTPARFAAIVAADALDTFDAQHGCEYQSVDLRNQPEAVQNAHEKAVNDLYNYNQMNPQACHAQLAEYAHNYRRDLYKMAGWAPTAGINQTTPRPPSPDVFDPCIAPSIAINVTPLADPWPQASQMVKARMRLYVIVALQAYQELLASRR